ncbi:hypothetical protein [Thioalkalivibrio paradoxus]|uniref:Uncharacterized protein n=1 Tax=Thioalkalivibrio paradoxus ARh 1 TaxID=713585 RepID=W0DSJ2_9GAMM|nr:hypothetical protein [Thioalkalivibrio paradoxus]AHE99825.1 hypothetical protein THITH_01030 [Thioalkalivibrio paradoxus ARh 1]
MRHVKMTLVLLAAAPLALLVGCAEMEEPFPAEEPGMEQQQEGTWGAPPEEAPPPERGMGAPPAEGEGMGAPPPEGRMPAPPDSDGAMQPEPPAGAPGDR